MMTPNQNDPHQSEDRARLIVAIVVSLAILFGFNYFVEKPRMEEAKRQAELQLKAAPATAAPAATPVKMLKSRSEVLAEGTRLPIRGLKVTGSISPKGARLDDLLLNGHVTELGGSELVPLLVPSGTDRAFYAESGWVADRTDIVLPTPDTVWQLASGSAREVTSGGAPVVFEWDNGQGLLFQKTIAVDDNYLFTITDKVTNNSGAEVRLASYNLIARHSLPEGFSGFFVHHEGPIAFLGDEFHEPSYADLDDGEKIEQTGVKGWLGITDKYWMAALLPKSDAAFDARIIGTKGHLTERHYQTDAVMPAVAIAAGASIENTMHVFAGVKNLAVMKDYENTYGIRNLELGLDFGMWYFITKPFFYLLHALAGMSGSIAMAILLITVIVRLAVFPLANKSFRSMAKMKTVAPQLKELQEKYSGDKAKMQMEMFELYKREQVNPFSGCWPVLVQIPIFFALYKVILISVELRHAPFWGWVTDLSAPDPTSIFNLFGLIPWTPPSYLMIGAWPMMFCATMIIQKRLSPPMPDPVQEKIQTWFPYIVTIMLAHFAAGLVIYWTWSNVLGILQQYYILRKVGGEETSLIRGHSSRRKKKDKHKEEKHKE